jgi:hypothetical protein
VSLVKEENNMATEKQRLTFISYSRADKNFALELAKELRSSGFHIWLDQLDIPTGARWDDEIQKALEQCEVFMVVLTPTSTASNNVKDEVGYAIDANKRIMPILLEHANVPFRLRRFQYVDFTDISYNEGIDSAKQLLRKLLDEPTEPRLESVSADLQGLQPKVDRAAELKADANRLARQRAEAIKVAREREQMERNAQAAPPTPLPSRMPSQPQPVRQSTPKLLPIIAGVTLVAILCLGGGYAIWDCCIAPTPTVPTTYITITVSPTFTPIVGATTQSPTEVIPTTPALPAVTIPSDPVDFIYFYYENINDRNYDLTWSLLSDDFKSVFNPGGKNPYMDFWNTVSNVEIYSAEQTKISDNATVVVINSNIRRDQLNYYLLRNNAQSNWLFYPMPDSFNVSCDRAPKRLSIGITAEVATLNDDLLLRSAPTDGTTIERMPPGTRVVVVDGPQCKYYRSGSVFLWWWKVRSPQGNQGWTVEGYDSRDPVFLQPIP